VWRRIWHFIVDLADGILSGMLYGHQGGLGIYSTRADAQNAAKLRRWAATSDHKTAESDEPTRRPSHRDDFDARIRRYRRSVNEPPER
jgi:hypothetical protein